MKTGGRLALYGLGLAVAFGGAFAVAAAAVPNAAVAGWQENGMKNHDADNAAADAPAHGEHSLKGLSVDTEGYVLSPVQAPAVVGEPGELNFQIQDATGAAVTDYTTSHDRDLHLIIARSDGALFRHVHPELDAATGTWSLPWQWTDAGSYRVFADFTPTGDDATGVTLTRLVHVAGEFTPIAPQPSRVDDVDGFQVSIEGDLVAGSAGELTISVTRDGNPVTELEPYLGAFGHLVALRDGDLAFLHVHAEGEEPKAGETAGPEIAFAATAPTAGRYLLYLDFQVDGEVHTASFVLDASHGGEAAGHEDETHSDDGH
ncbi:heavy-metal-associated domain-containing protein [Microbacterium sp.]|uniref:heavy-metal-associated domain-containing protein n=1 Tax=Microbacterium sp. TaxID=51671 RepID=UPI002810CF0B|nr:heavy-metal-associated domain-containing protein [Microbacterium sp.]